MKQVLKCDRDATVVLHRDEHDESGEYKVHTEIWDDDLLNHNQKLRNAKLMNQGSKTPFMDGGVIIRSFAIPPAAWLIFKKKNKSLVRNLMSADQVTRERAALQLSIRHPEWVTNTGK